jgi:hypothetical protein
VEPVYQRLDAPDQCESRHDQLGQLCRRGHQQYRHQFAAQGKFVFPFEAIASLKPQTIKSMKKIEQSPAGWRSPRRKRNESFNAKDAKMQKAQRKQNVNSLRLCVENAGTKTGEPKP